MEIPKAYNPKDYEEDIYQTWESSGFFNPDICIEKKVTDKKAPPFSIVLPPPNVTGELHLGHASMLAYEDLMVRYHRLKGDRTLWIPGTDHAAIATQAKVEKILAQEGKTRHDFGRKEFLKRVRKYVEKSKNTIHTQMRKMGSSLDWSRERYTLDPDVSQAVYMVFERMFDDGLIYRGYRIINWCPRCQSTLADDEVIYQEQEGKLYYIKYGPVSIATTRPETKIGDTGLAVHPDDKRYQSLIGKTIDVPLGKINISVKVFASTDVDPTFGTGAIGVTPAHSAIDYAWAEKNKLAIKKIIGEDGKMTEKAGPYAGLGVWEARQAFVDDLKKAGLLEKIEEIKNNVSLCYRCNTAIEPLTSKQWFINIDKKITLKNSNIEGIKSGHKTSLKELALHVIKTRQINILPKRFEKAYFRWIENLHDWCISRQIWWGHRIPIWYCGGKYTRGKDSASGCGNVVTSIKKPKKCSVCANQNFEQEDDTLDTWFSSSLWTFSTLLDKTDFEKYESLEDWAEKSPDLKTYHPTSVLETGYDILFFWVARMILMTTYNMGEIPFHTVYLHGLVRDKYGKKMSKSLGNGIDPVEMINKFGTDALRLSMTIGASPGNDIKMYEEKIAGFRNLVNKLWNISRYILLNVRKIERIKSVPKPRTLSDEWILHEFHQVIGDVTEDIENFKFSPAGEKLYEFTWRKLADWYVEIAKIEGEKDIILLYILERLLILWHPFTPFVTEAIWKNFSSHELLMVQAWPRCPRKKNTAKNNGTQFRHLQTIITCFRNLRARAKIPAGKTVAAEIYTRQLTKLIKAHYQIIEMLARVKLTIVTQPEKKDCLKTVKNEYELYLPISQEVKNRIKKEKTELEKYIKKLKSKLSNQNFLAKAPKEIVKMEKDKLKQAQEKISKF